MTVKNYDQLIASFEDNTAGNIGADDMQDYVESIWQVRGGIEINGVDVLALTTTPQAVDWFDTEQSTNLNVTTDLPSGSITVVAPGGAGLYLVTFFASFAEDSNSDYFFDLLVNGSPYATGFAASMVGSTDAKHVSFVIPVQAPENSTFSLEVSTLAGTTNLTSTYSLFHIVRVAG